MTRPEESYLLRCVVDDLETSGIGGVDPRWVAAAQEKKVQDSLLPCIFLKLYS